MDKIEAYYEKNFEYQVLREIATNKEALITRIGPNSVARSQDSCFRNILENVVLIITAQINPIKALIAIGRVDEYDVRQYAEDYYGVTGGGENRRGDAYRHIIWNALLANNYPAISSKLKRKLFEKQITDYYESCLSSGIEDSTAMDNHNNAIGRKLWDENTSYRKLFGFTIGLNCPSTSELNDIVEDAVNEESCFIVKNKLDNEDDFPINLLSQDQTTSQIVTKINNTDANTIVYFEGTIAPSRYYTRKVFSHWEYYPCGDGIGNFYEAHARRVPSIEECRRAIYRTVTEEIIPC